MRRTLLALVSMSLIASLTLVSILITIKFKTPWVLYGFLFMLGAWSIGYAWWIKDDTSRTLQGPKGPY